MNENENCRRLKRRDVLKAGLVRQLPGEGSELHCQAGGQLRANQEIFDWIDG